MNSKILGAIWNMYLSIKTNIQKNRVTLHSWMCVHTGHLPQWSCEAGGLDFSLQCWSTDGATATTKNDCMLDLTSFDCCDCDQVYTCSILISTCLCIKKTREIYEWRRNKPEQEDERVCVNNTWVICANAKRETSSSFDGACARASCTRI